MGAPVQGNWVMEDLGGPEFTMDINGCAVPYIPVDSGCGVNIMTGETTNCLGYKKFEPLAGAM